MCVMEKYEYQTSTMKLQSGDLLVLISDGITEAQNPAKDLYGGVKIIHYLNSVNQKNHSADIVCRGLYENVKRFMQDAGQSDDITIMTLKFNTPGV